MTRSRVILSANQSELEALGIDALLWRRPEFESSFHVDFGPWAEPLGSLPNQHVDLIRLTAAVYVVDRISPRGGGVGNRWERDLELEVPLIEPERWNEAHQQLTSAVNFLTGDRWTFEFIGAAASKRPKTPKATSTKVVCLFSGGSDSFCGALLALRETGQVPHLISHWDSNVVRHSQREALRRFFRLTNKEATVQALRVGRRRKQIGSGIEFPQEPSSRSRSLLFIALGVAAASIRDAELWMAENGFVSLNVPLAPERRSSLTTRTTHPWFLDEIRKVFEQVDIGVQFRNPFEGKTKGEIFSDLVEAFSPDAAADGLAHTHSCARSGANYAGFAPSTQCGVCFACLVRRGAFATSRVEDRTDYIETLLSVGDPRRAEWLTPHRRSDYETIRYAVERGITMADVASVGLPDRIRLADALDLAQRGLKELGGLNIY